MILNLEIIENAFILIINKYFQLLELSLQIAISIPIMWIFLLTKLRESIVNVIVSHCNMQFLNEEQHAER